MIAASAAAVMLSDCAPPVVPAGRPLQTPRLTDDRYVAADGTSLPLSVWPAANGSPRAVILALQGRWPGTDKLVEDARAIATLVQARHPGVPFYLAGESIGGARWWWW